MNAGFYVRAATALLIAALLILWLGEATNIDLMLADIFYDAHGHRFPWRHSWFAAILIHRWLKMVLIAFGLAVIARYIFAWRKSEANLLMRSRLGVVALSAALIPLVISLLKHYSALHCPWDIERYGGNAPYLRLLEPLPSSWHSGQCFPAGHASAGLWLAAFAVFWLPDRPRTALAVYAGGIGTGLFLGWVQQMRGAHFMTHTLWSAWLASAIIVMLIALCTTVHGVPQAFQQRLKAED